jgi:DNA-directed RNA polymerase subunit M/transcription elongation factor TFIIS
MAANTESVLITCPRCRAWPIAVHTPLHPKQAILLTVLRCKTCGHEVEGPEIHDEQHRERE